jgi:hypothetical protein
MPATSKPAEIVAAPKESAPDPYCGTPLGVEAAWWPNGIHVSGVAATPETTIPPMELQCWPGCDL